MPSIGARLTFRPSFIGPCVPLFGMSHLIVTDIPRRFVSRRFDVARPSFRRTSCQFSGSRAGCRRAGSRAAAARRGGRFSAFPCTRIRDLFQGGVTSTIEGSHDSPAGRGQHPQQHRPPDTPGWPMQIGRGSRERFHDKAFDAERRRRGHAQTRSDRSRPWGYGAMGMNVRSVGSGDVRGFR